METTTMAHETGKSTERANGHNYQVQRLATDLVSVVCLDPDDRAYFPTNGQIEEWFGVKVIERFNGAGENEILYRVAP
jgi:hypothetical protein